MRVDAIIFSLTLVADRVIKILIPRLMDLHQSIPVIPGFFHLTYVRNTGGAFGILAGWDSPFRRYFFIFASIAALMMLYYLYRQASAGSSRYLRLSVVLIASGAVGNLYDRIVTGEVVDFLDFFIGRHHWPAFNLADTAITTGALLLGYLYLTGWDTTPEDTEESGVP